MIPSSTFRPRRTVAPVLALALTLVLALAPGAPLAPVARAAGGDDATSATNVFVTIRIGGEQDGAPIPTRSYSLVGVAGDRPISLLGGERVPIPTTSWNAAAAASNPAPVTSFTYQNVGFTAQVEASMLPDGRIRLFGSIENSQLVPTTVSTAGAQPQVATFEQHFLVVVESGEPVRVMNAEGTLRTVWFEIEASTTG